MILTLAATCAVAAFAGCGDGPDEPSGMTAKPPGSPPTQSSATGSAGNAARDAKGGPTLTGNVDEARKGAATVNDVYSGFKAAAADGVAATDVLPANTLESADSNESLAKVCALLSRQAKRETIAYAKGSSGLNAKWTCRRSIALLLRRTKQSGGLAQTLRAKIVGVNVVGDRATASVRFGTKDLISSIPLINEGGQWKLAASPSSGGG